MVIQIKDFMKFHRIPKRQAEQDTYSVTGSRKPDRNSFSTSREQKKEKVSLPSVQPVYTGWYQIF